MGGLHHLDPLDDGAAMCANCCAGMCRDSKEREVKPFRALMIGLIVGIAAVALPASAEPASLGDYATSTLSASDALAPPVAATPVLAAKHFGAVAPQTAMACYNCEVLGASGKPVKKEPAKKGGGGKKKLQALAGPGDGDEDAGTPPSIRRLLT
jgi:hypothetical protein